MTVPTFASADSAEPKPTIVLVHGAWADGSSWSHVIPILQRRGYKVAAPPFSAGVVAREDEVGVATGLAYTPSWWSHG